MSRHKQVGSIFNEKPEFYKQNICFVSPKASGKGSFGSVRARYVSTSLGGHNVMLLCIYLFNLFSDVCVRMYSHMSLMYDRFNTHTYLPIPQSSLYILKRISKVNNKQVHRYTFIFAIDCSSFNKIIYATTIPVCIVIVYVKIPNY